MNKYLDYCEKGLGMVVTVHPFGDYPYTQYCEYVDDLQQNSGLPKEILWTKGFDKADGGYLGSMSLIDQDGQLVWYMAGLKGLDPSDYIREINPILQRYFGDPLPHDEYSSVLYESTDFSMDGRVLTLQKATRGKGIDVVIMADQAVDKDMVEGGAFEEDARNAMEYFFMLEPFKSLRDRFNFYAVKAVSINDFRGSNHVFNYENEKVMQYVSLVPGVDMNNVTTIVYNRNPNFSFFVSGHTEMFDNGSSIAYLDEGNITNILIHEAGGHGFGKLLDEYIYEEAQNNILPEDIVPEFREWIYDTYHSRGWGMNVSPTDDPELETWANFLKDERYNNEVGIYQGAWLWPADLWRSSEIGVMHNEYSSFFNAPSREAIYKRIMELSEGEDWKYDYEEFVTFDREVMENALPTVESAPAHIVRHRMPRIVHKSEDGLLQYISFPTDSGIETSRPTLERNGSIGTPVKRPGSDRLIMYLNR